MSEVMNGARAPGSVTPVSGLLTPRMVRLLALLASREWLTRKEVESGAGVLNGPGLIHDLRGVLGYGAIEMQTFQASDRDGKVCRPGRYRLTDTGRKAAVDLGLLPE